MFYVYVLQSLADRGLYIGFTGDLKKRIIEHNSQKGHSTKNRVPFKLVYYEAFVNKTDARKREIELKKNGQQREFLYIRIHNSLRS